MAPPRKETTPDPDPLALSVGRRVAALREQRDLSPQQFADRAGMSVAYLWRVESGRQNLSLRNVARLAQAFSISLSELFADVPIPPDAAGKRKYAKP